ncbi:Phosphoribosylaminoimidazole carboxylase ATPase subunit [Bathymodiolus heckerae thiotrophic gill symbiont]|uniref:5-(carboxyamino)imidazole ribonucleotide synthase n=1 Tax=Bathymodiolus heckerae thiotrophic gill symbiont TaxID=1052212 RepID=UPI0010B3B9B2|nr:5-(carboxyamino)imidazole ribonucleotide synthase [Bathymodiolus heckerae thiotrophic gill symbiont]SMN13518.1 Phosphoribosylaminoimidazole carboxylase ATPase subunit [Bathymodiolus heckerae thiotrophic gill symbiont]SMN16511.1 Phosphoribosylaminoimidazole carboxylase ATPase subunit [uncultured Candidatus Thioglobus sp.]
MKIGVLGAGQLGRMLAISGYPLNHQFGFSGNTHNEPASLLGRMFALEDNTDNVNSLVEFADVITFESENTDVAVVKEINKTVTVYPSEKSLFITQHRGREKALFDQLNIPCAPYQMVNSEMDLRQALENIGLPAILKTATEGYDGKGQFLMRDASQITEAWSSMNGVESVLEGFVDFKRELSLIAVRGINNEYEYYPLVENDHHEGILRLSVAPARNIDKSVQKIAEHYMQTLLDEMDHTGVLTIELFETKDGLVVNEMAPRVHNSGHWSIEGANTSQFENHVRAITGMPLGDTTLTHPFCAMINIIGKTGDTDIVLNIANAHLHLYDKKERANRKLGHIAIMANSQDELDASIKKLKNFLP